MNTDKNEELPSFQYARFQSSEEGESEDCEGLLIDLLSKLSSLEDIAPQFQTLAVDIDHDWRADMVAWMSKFVYEKVNVDDCGIKRENGVLLYEWSVALAYIHDLLKHVAPFEVHFIASQSIYLSDNASLSHRILCLMLFVHSLRQCPDLREKRFKRWQSLVCETLRMFQDSIPILEDAGGTVDSGKWTFSLLVNHIVPSCLHVVDRLPLDNTYHVAIFSGLVGTSSNVVERLVGQCHEDLSKGTEDSDGVTNHFEESLYIMHDTVQWIIQTFERFGRLSANSLWIESTLQPLDKISDRNDNVTFLMHRDDLSWWIHLRERHEPEHRVAGMDTSIHEIGLGQLAVEAFRERPKVYHPSFLWAIWSPHAALIFRNAGQYPLIQRELAYRFLESLVGIVPKESIHPEKIRLTSGQGVHLELFNSLSNQLMARVKSTKIDGDESNGNETDASVGEEVAFNQHSQRTVKLIKNFLTRYTTSSQVQIIERVIQESSSPGLKARFLDLLRPLTLISDPQTEKLLWELLLSIVENLFQKYWNRQEQMLIEASNLIDQDVEISVGAITMIQMWSLAKGKTFNDDRIEFRADLQGFRDALQKQIASWTENSSIAPEHHYRLFLLDSALEHTCQSLIK